MQFQKIPNPYSEDVRLGVGIFRGKWGFLLVMSGLIMVLVFQGSAMMGIDLPFAAFCASIPFVLSATYVLLFVLGRPPSYGKDVFKTGVFHLRQSLYLEGWIDRPPTLWKKGKPPVHP